MSLVCRITGHEPGSDQVCNAGRCFTRCRRCGGDLVKEGEDWQPVPKGFRVVWRDPAAPAPDKSVDQPPEPEGPTPPPLPPAPQLREVVPAAPAAAARGHVLICDDDPLVADLLAHRLTGSGYRVSVAADGGEALERLGEERPDAVLLDATMPVHDGYEVLRRIRADERLAAVPVIMLTARKQENDVVGALQLGADDFLVKPFIPAELMTRLARIMQIAEEGPAAGRQPGLMP
jgi:CheY-like chemotaxis protein